jgi:hypothetical protein
MLISPSISEILRGVTHEMGTSLKQGLNDPVKNAQIDTIIGVLSSCAVRSENEKEWMKKEVTSILSVAKKFVSNDHSSDKISKALKDFNSNESDEKKYQSASNILSLLGDLGSSVGEELASEVWSLMEQRLQHEAYIIGGGFEAAGRN